MQRLLIGFLVWWFSFGFVASYASIWNSQAYPAENVSVTLKDSRFLTGDLRQDWDRKWVLTQPDGSESRFNDSEVLVMAFPPQLSGESLGYAKMWRGWVPVVIFAGAFFLWLLRGIRARAKTEAPGAL
jgi:hypothetical protein